jgi:glycosyltransferase involved in cell wall biosynthesis
MTGLARPLAVEMVVPALVTGGMEMMTVDLARALRARGHRVGITCLEEEGALADGLKPAGIPVAVVPCPGLAPLARAHPGLRDHFAQRAPDIVHAHNGVWAKAALAARAAGVPAVMHTAHGFDHDEPWFGDALRWWAGLHTDMVVAVSRPLREHFVRKARVNPSRVVTVLNGIDTSRFSPGERSGVLRGPLGIGPDVPLIGCVARLDPVKNHALLLEAMAHLVRQVPDIHLALVGDGPLRDMLQGQVRALGLDGRVLLAGTLADAAPAYRDLDIFVLPSVSEGTSISVLEAMASGTPVVATRVGGTPWLLGDGACGELVPSGDSEALAGAVTRLLGDEKERSRLAHSARARVLAEFDHAAMVRTYEQLYGRIAGDGPSPVLMEA